LQFVDDDDKLNIYPSFTTKIDVRHQ